MNYSPSAVSLPAILSANFIGLLLIGCVCMHAGMRTRKKDPERALLNAIAFCAALSCILDPVCALVNGRDTVFAKILNFHCNNLLFLSGVIGVWCWTMLMEHHLFGELTLRRKRMLAAPMLVLLGAIIADFFHPALFSISKEDVYVRQEGYLLAVGIEVSYLLYTLIRYFMARRTGGILKFFPVWNFIIPTIGGAVVQTCFYGISVIPACCAVAYASITVALMNEKIYKDPLTGIYNRAYLDYVLGRIRRKKDTSYTGIMIDLNGFKSINDRFGHLTGDEALIRTAGILKRSAGERGVVIRYAGDEFIVLINSYSGSALTECLDRIRMETDAFNESSPEPYRLSMAFGFAPLDPDKSAAEFLNIIDENMYRSKRSYYASKGHDRRHRE